ncbi:MAG: type IVB secretion system protein IcmJDotN [Coxiellaceae bacterium]|jgi:intracellular multiplication protein IcmJ|nr:type IVB secretion system protein IcmJDotN [Coxiellaceae bacterium]
MMGLYPIKLAVTPEGWRLFSIRKVDLAFQAFKRQVLKRDRYVCQYCGFQATKYQEVVNVDNNYHNNKISNLTTACCFCVQCFFSEAVGKDDYGGGVLIYLPEISQNDLNGFCHILFCAISNHTSFTADAQDVYRSLKSRSTVVEEYLGEGMSDPSLFGRMLIGASEEDRKKIGGVVLPFLRLLPSYSKFSDQVKSWSEDALDDVQKVDE